MFLENDRDLGVKNGMLGTVTAVEANALQIALDGSGAGPGEQEPGLVRVDFNSYQSVDHGYATTIHKNQGATVDRSFVLASGTMDRHLTYVAMTRHRDGVQMYASQEEFTARKANQMVAAGKLVEHGVAPYERKAGNRDSYFVTLENAHGERHTTWGVGLKDAMAEAAPEIGATIALKHEGSQSVRLPDGTETHRNAWKVMDGQSLAYDQLVTRLSRSGQKETTLDYTREFAERRGIAEAIGIHSEIEITPMRERGQDLAVLPGHQDRRALVRSPDGAHLRGPAGPELGHDTPQVLHADRGERSSPEAGPRRGMFDGLKLSRGSTVERPAQDPGDDSGPQQAGKQRPKRSMFDGLKLSASRGSTAERPEREGERLTPDRAASDRLAERARPMSGFEQAVDGYARAISSVMSQRREGLPILDGQRQEMDRAGLHLDQTRPGSSDLLHSALRYDPQTMTALTQSSGRERVGQLVAGMDRERALQADPNVRADRFIERWNELKSERQQLRGWQNDEARGNVETEMRGMSKSLERDPQLESTLRNRSQELGINPVRQEQGLSLLREMERQVQSRNQSMGMER